MIDERQWDRNGNDYNKYRYHKIFGMFEIFLFAAIPYFSTWVFNIFINILNKRLNMVSLAADDTNQTTALSKFSRLIVFLGLVT